MKADAEALPFEDNTFHLYTIAFGLRNVTNVSGSFAASVVIHSTSGERRPFSCFLHVSSFHVA